MTEETSGIKDNKETQSAAPPVRIRKGDVARVRIESLSFGGAGVARLDGGFVIFVVGGLPGDLVDVVIRLKKKGYAEAQIREVVEPSPDRIEPRCEHFGMCGGCKLQHYPYDLQLIAKRQQIVDHLERIAGMKEPPVEDIVGMENPWEYRNKMEFTFSTFKDGNLKLGLHRPGFFDRIVDIDHCHLVDDRFNIARNVARGFFRELGLSSHNIRKHEGLLRNLVLRSAGDGMMACLSTHTAAFAEHSAAFTKILRDNVPDLASIHWFVNELLSGVAIAGQDNLLYGAPFITETVMGINLRISPTSFAQTNTSQCEKLYGTLMEFADFQGGEEVFDLYSGTGPIAMLASRGAKRVTAIESNAEAVEDAKKNVADNGITNVEFITAEVEKALPALCAETSPDVVIADPPRAGLHAKGLAAIAAAKPRKVIYVSCNPSTMARDAVVLIEAGYTMSKARPVDMFPHTAHIECVARFDLKEV